MKEEKRKLSFWEKNEVLKITEFRFYMMLRFGLIFALNMQSTAIYYWIYDMTRDKLKLGLVGLFEVIPAIIFSLFAGHIVDLKEKRNVLRLVLTGYFLLSVWLFINSTSVVHTQIGEQLILIFVYTGVFFGGVLRAFVGPAQFALIGLIVPRPYYPDASRWSSMAWQSGSVIGPLAAGLLLGAKGIEVTLCVVVVVTAFLLIPIYLIKKKPILKTEREPILQSLSAGVKFVLRTPAMLGAQCLDMFAVLFGGAVALLPVFQQEILKLTPMWFGILRSAPGIGAVLMLVIFAFFPVRKNPGYKLFGAVFGFGLCIIIFGISKNAYLSFAILVISGMFDAVSVVIRQTIMQLLTPDAMRGRVASINTIFTSSSNELGDFESGLMAHFIGTVPAVVFGGSMTVFVVIITFVLTKKLRNFSFQDYQVLDKVDK